MGIVKQWQTPWHHGQANDATTLELVKLLRDSEPTGSSKAALEILQSGIHPQGIRDGLMLSSAELVMRQPGIVPLHAVTTTNAITYLMSSVGDDQLRKWLLLQNVSFLSHFAQAAKSRGQLNNLQIDQLAQVKVDVAPRELLLQTDDRSKIAQAILSLAQEPAAAGELVQSARELIFLKGTDAHDYKFSSAAIEDYALVSPKWRAAYLRVVAICSSWAATKTARWPSR